MTSALDIFGSLEQHRGRIEQNRENGARLAKSHLTWQTTGWGEIQVDTVLDFGVTFIEPPSFTFGYALDDGGPDLQDGRFPRGFAFVYRYQRTPPKPGHVDGFYRGAWVAFVVETEGFQLTNGSFDFGADPEYVLNWSLHFEGIALKDLPDAVLDKVVTGD